MPEDDTIRGMNFTCYHAGPKEGWSDFRSEPPLVPRVEQSLVLISDALRDAGAAAQFAVSTGSGGPRSQTPSPL